MHHFLFNIITLCGAAIFFVPLFRRFGLGAILAYLFSGIIIGPDVIGLITESNEILHISELGVVFLLFIIGLELAPEKLWQMRASIFGMGLLQVILTGFILMGAGLLLGLSLPAAYACGFALALSSTAFSLQILQDHNQTNTTHGQGSFSILMFQDIAIVPLLASLSLFKENTELQISLLGILQIFGLILGLGLAGHFLLRHILRLIADSKTPEVFTATSLLIVVGAALLMESAGLSLGMGAFLAGVFLANSEYRHELETSLLPFKGLLLGLFFMAVGMALDLNVLAKFPHWVLLISLGFMFIKGIVIYVLGRSFKLPKESSRNMAFTLSLGGEFAFVLLASALSESLIDAELTSLLNASVTLSMALTPFLFSLNQKYLRKYSEINERPYDSLPSDNVEVIVAGFGRFGQIVSRFLNAEDIKYTLLDHSASQVEVARRFGNKVYYGDASRLDILESAGAQNAKCFVLAIDDPVQSLTAAKVVLEHFPHMKIIARARNRKHALDLMNLGIEHVVRETYFSSLEVVRQLMSKRGLNQDRVERAIKKFQHHDSQILKKQLELRDDEKKFLDFTRTANRELEQILKEDKTTT